MLFVRLGQFAAWLMLISGALPLVSGIAFAIHGDQELFRHYFPSRSTGEAINKGLYWIAVGIAFGLASQVAGVLTRMAKSEQ